MALTAHSWWCEIHLQPLFGNGGMMLTTSRAEPDAADNASFFRQCQLEQDLQRQAREAWDEARRKDGRRHHGRLVLSALPALSAAIEEMRKRPGPKAIACLAPLSSDQIAYTALRVLLSDDEFHHRLDDGIHGWR